MFLFQSVVGVEKRFEKNQAKKSIAVPEYFLNQHVVPLSKRHICLENCGNEKQCFLSCSFFGDQVRVCIL